MTHSPTPAERAALRVATAAAMSPDGSYDLVSAIVFALGAAQLLQLRSAVDGPLGDERLAGIREREQAATPGPWVTDGAELYQGEVGAVFPWVGEFLNIGDLPQSYANAAFAAHAREDVRVLLAEVARLRDELAETNKALAAGDKERGELKARVVELEAAQPIRYALTEKAVSDPLEAAASAAFDVPEATR